MQLWCFIVPPQAVPGRRRPGTAGLTRDQIDDYKDERRYTQNPSQKVFTHHAPLFLKIE